MITVPKKSIAPEMLINLADRIESHLGLSIKQNQWKELERNLKRAAESLKHDNAESLLQWLLNDSSNVKRLESIAQFLTNGETYFFRERNRFEPMARHILQSIIQEKTANKSFHIRILSAACSSGEEPYSLAIMLDHLLPDQRNWNIEVIASDINDNFLNRAKTGVYRQWSFRGTPDWVMQSYFTKEDDTYILNSKIRNRVTFRKGNLADPNFLENPGFVTGFDLIFCRNVLIYFSSEGASRTANHLKKWLTKKGWLVLSPPELVFLDASDLERNHLDDNIFFRNGNGKGTLRRTTHREIDLSSFLPSLNAQIAQTRVFETPKPDSIKQKPERIQPAPEPENKSIPDETVLREMISDNPTKVIKILKPVIEKNEAKPHHYTLYTKAFMMSGQLEEALKAASKSVELDKMNTTNRFLLAMIHLELKDIGKSKEFLLSILYLDHNHLMSLYTLANLCQQEGLLKQAEKHYGSLLKLIENKPDDESIKDGDGMTIARIKFQLQHHMGSKMERVN